MTALAISTPDGESLHVAVTGEGSPILVLHGFTGSSAAMAGVVESLSAVHTTVSVDLVGHGMSSVPADPHRYRAEHLMDDLEHVIAELGVERPGMVGYSMGGRLGLTFACSRPNRLSRLAIIGVGPGFSDERERAARATADEELARFIEEEGVGAFVERWMAHPLIADQAAEGTAAWEEARLRRLGQDPLGLTGMLRGFGQGKAPPLRSSLPRLKIPLLVVVGGEDALYRVPAEQVAALVPGAELAFIAGAGHATHLAAPGTTGARLTEFFGEGP